MTQFILYSIFPKNNTKSLWHFFTKTQQKVFDQLKLTLAERQVVKVFYPTKDIILCTDASEHSILGILLQKGNPLMSLSRCLTSTELNYSLKRKLW